jgi:hypothetical protein
MWEKGAKNETKIQTEPNGNWYYGGCGNRYFYTAFDQGFQQRP